MEYHLSSMCKTDHQAPDRCFVHRHHYLPGIMRQSKYVQRQQRRRQMHSANLPPRWRCDRLRAMPHRCGQRWHRWGSAAGTFEIQQRSAWIAERSPGSTSTLMQRPFSNSKVQPETNEPQNEQTPNLDRIPSSIEYYQLRSTQTKWKESEQGKKVARTATTSAITKRWRQTILFDATPLTQRIRWVCNGFTSR